MNINTKLLVLAVIFLQFASFRESFVESCEAYRFVQQEGKALVNHVINTMTASLKEVCLKACVWLPWCFSVNVRHTSWGSVECDLNNSSKKANPGNLVSREGTDYHQMAGDVPDYLDHSMEVKRKEDLGNGWYRYGKSALKLFKDVMMTWLDARSHCQSLGGDLMSISSDHENDFVYDVFVKDHVNNTNGTTLEGGVAQFRLDGTDRDIKFLTAPGIVQYEVADGRKALFLSGHKTSVEIPAVRLTGEFTIILWVRFQTTSRSDVYSIFKAHPKSVTLSLTSDTDEIGCSITTDSSLTTTTNNVRIQYGVWTHIAISLKTDERKTIFVLAINGIRKQRLNIADTFSGEATKQTAYYTLGMSRSRFSDPRLFNSFKGHMSNLKMYNRKFVVSEMKEDFEQSIDIPDLSAVWIGLNRTNHTSQFVWSDGNPHDHFTALMTSHHMKILVTNHHCAAAGKDGQWFGRHCLEKKPFICEKPVQ